MTTAMRSRWMICLGGLALAACDPAGRGDDDDDDCPDGAACPASCDEDPDGEGCPCSTEEPIECWTGGASARPNAGPCHVGRRECSDGVWGPCVGQVLPTAELCNDIDDDCDGEIDDGVLDEDGQCEPADDCDARTRWIYVISSDDELVRFEPDSLELSPVGRVECDDAPRGYHPFSMAVDRSGWAWVLFLELDGFAPGRLFRVSVADASCEATDFEPGQDGFDRFGMGFVSDEAGGEAETLFVAGGEDLLGQQRLGRIDMGSLLLSSVGDLPGSPELTGTGDAELWGFFPDTYPPMVAAIDRDEAELGETFELDDVDTGSTQAWAFAFWGGRFYLFLETVDDLSTNVLRLTPDTGDVRQVVSDTGYEIVGAGVSTCAPVDLI